MLHRNFPQSFFAFFDVQFYIVKIFHFSDFSHFSFCPSLILLRLSYYLLHYFFAPFSWNFYKSLFIIFAYLLLQLFPIFYILCMISSIAQPIFQLIFSLDFNSFFQLIHLFHQNFFFYKNPNHFWLLHWFDVLIKVVTWQQKYRFA